MLAQRKLLTRCSPVCRYSSSFQLKKQSHPAAPQPYLDITMKMNNAGVKIGIPSQKVMQWQTTENKPFWRADTRSFSRFYGFTVL